jgi:predicted permease
VERVRTLPGVEAATWSENRPLVGGGFSRSVFPEGAEIQPGQRGIIVQVNGTWTGYFATFGIPIVQGRDFTDADRDPNAGVVIINESAAKRFWPGRDAIGKRFKFYGDEKFTQVVGVAKDGKYNFIGEDPQPYAYYPAQQTYAPAMTLVARTSGDPRAALPAMQQEIRKMEATLPVLNPQTMTDVIDASLWAPRMGAMLLGLFGVLALTLATVGIYGVMSYSVTRRTREIGIRMALGAKGGDVLGMVLGEGMVLTCTGMVLGIGAAVAVTRLVAKLLFGVSPTDLPTFAGISLLLGVVALVANYLPARRATAVDPLVTLKYE